jgi:hypothetical protein
VEAEPERQDGRGLDHEEGTRGCAVAAGGGQGTLDVAGAEGCWVAR